MANYLSQLKSTKNTSKGFKRSIERKLCEWLNEQYGCKVDPDNRNSLVEELSDGVVLCKLIRDLSGNKRVRFKAKRPNIFQKNENIRTFSKQCKKMGISGIATLSPSDLRDGSTKKTMACLMHLYRKSKDWVAKGATRKEPGVLKMVLIKPKRAKIEIVTDYLSQLKVARRKRMACVVANVSIQPVAIIAHENKVNSNDDIDRPDNGPVQQQPELTNNSEIVSDTMAAKSVSVTKNDKAEQQRQNMALGKSVNSNEVIAKLQGTNEREIDENESSTLVASSLSNQTTKEQTPTTASLKNIIDSNTLQIKFQELKLECGRLQRLNLLNTAKIEDLEISNKKLQATAAKELKTRLVIESQLKSRSDKALELDKKVKNAGGDSTTANEIHTNNFINDNPTRENVAKSEPSKSDNKSLDESDDEKSFDYGIGSDEEEEEEEEIDELEINKEADKQISMAMEEARKEVNELKSECAALRMKYAQAQHEAQTKGDELSASRSKKEVGKHSHD